MGAFGAWAMGASYPNFFSAIAPVAGGGMSWRTPNFKTTPVFAVHGDMDVTVPCIYSRLMVDGVNKNGGDAQLVVLENKGHGDGIEYAYEHTDLLEWTLRQRRENFAPVPETFSPEYDEMIYG